MTWNQDDPESLPSETILYAVLLFSELRRRTLEWKVKPEAILLEHYRSMFKEQLWSADAKDPDREAFVATLDKVYTWVKKNPEKTILALSLPPYRVSEWAQSNNDMTDFMAAMERELPPIVLTWFIVVLCECQEIFSVDDSSFESLPKEEPPLEVKEKLTALVKAYLEVRISLCII